MLSQTLLLALLAPLALSSPIPSDLAPRAGGPVGKPIPDTCSTPSITPATPTWAFKTSPEFATANLVYSYSLPAESSVDDSTASQQCLEQCYGFGDPGECKSILYAHDVEYNIHGSTGKGTSCQMFRERITPEVLQPVTDGSYAYTAAKAVDIDCPSS